MRPGQDQTHNPWFCCQTCYLLLRGLVPGALCVATILQGLKIADHRGSSGSVGRVFDLGEKSHLLETPWRHCVVPLSKMLTA